ncbi:hypothetical protein B0J13DRAFT_38280 [Dactylonectria estremocensis]|uniref:Uncharacterized protein n=1 Tax=Dactylonectria estremocensis TaxID=1079267 RepID=A0A9P9FMB5_9HYPO|nr:hypothetical protein B0J13DRAFT_38280 [Dactylonectria estremocensis]
MDGASACPENENSTDCLLRSLLQIIERQSNQNNKQFNWDPIAFGFTVPIAILAAFFALFTILQACIAAGSRGRRKSNRRAIGQWSHRTTREWNWAEMSFQFTAATPVMTARHMIYIFDNPELISPVPHESIFFKKPAAATWVGLLQELEVGDIDMDRMALKRTAADYLPDDLLAAPAYSDVGFIVGTMAALGATSWRRDTQSLYPVILGQGFQFDFRQHPNLGTIGAFSRYGAAPWKGPSPVNIAAALRHARGKIEVGSLLSLDTRVPFQDPRSEGPKHTINVSDVTNPGAVLCAVHTQNFDCQPDRSLCKAGAIFNRADRHHLIWLFLASTPHDVPAIFPSRPLQTVNVLTTLALNSRFWSSPATRRKFSLMNDETTPNMLMEGEAVWIGPEYPAQISDSHISTLAELLSIDNFLFKTKYAIKWETQLGIKPALLRKKAVLCGFRAVLQACLKSIHGTEIFMRWFNALYQTHQRYFRILVLLQLRQVDQWLQSIKAQAVRCRVVTLYCTTVAFLDADQAIRTHSFGYSVVPDKQTIWAESLASFCLHDDVLKQHFKTLRVLQEFVNEFQLGIFAPNDRGILEFLNKGQHNRFERGLAEEYTRTVKVHSRPLGHLMAFGPNADTLAITHYATVDLLLLNLSRILGSCLQELQENKEFVSVEHMGKTEDEDGQKKTVGSWGPNEDEPDQELPNASTREDDDQDEDRIEKRGQVLGEHQGEDIDEDRDNGAGKHPADEPATEDPEDSDGENERHRETPSTASIDNVLIWRCILVAMLFWTAPDNTDLLESTIWEHVIPVI